MSNEELLLSHFHNPSIDKKNEIIIKYKNLIHYVIKNINVHTNQILEYNDFFQSGVVGLSQAIDRFNPNVGTKFETYAMFRIKGTILDQIRKIKGKEISYNRIKEKFPDIIYLEEKSNSRVKCLASSNFNLSDIQIEKMELSYLIKMYINHLPKRDKIIIYLYYFRRYEFKDIGKLLNITVSRVSQIHKRIIKKLNEEMEITDFK